MTGRMFRANGLTASAVAPGLPGFGLLRITLLRITLLRITLLRMTLLGVSLLGLSLLGLSGCGGGGESSTVRASTDERSSQSQSTDAATRPATRPSLPVAAISSETASSQAARSGDDLPLSTAKRGTPEWMLREIARIRTELSAQQDGAQLSDQSRKGHEKIIELARLAIAATHDDPEREQLFNNAVHYLSDSRLELAMGGDTGQSQLLVEDAESLYRRDQQSFAAVESAYKVVQLAQRKAERHGRTNPEWVSEFANQARLFASRFPHEPNRSAFTLLTAGQTCDRAGLTDDAKNCFLMVQSQFPDTVFAEQVNGFLRRLSLVGQPLELAGPTIEGGYVSIDDDKDQPVLVVFWAATSPQFQQDCEPLKELQQRFASAGLGVIGVNLDVDEAEIDNFLSAHDLPWPHIFYSEPDKRGGRHPLARYYGVQQVPTYWLVDRTGTVVATPADLEELTARLQDLLGAP